MAKKKFYAYKVDGEQGIASSWDECSALVEGEPGACFEMEVPWHAS